MGYGRRREDSWGLHTLGPGRSDDLCRISLGSVFFCVLARLLQWFLG